MKKHLTLGIAVALITSSTAHAQLIGYEPFAYTSGQSLVGQGSAGGGFAGGMTQFFNVSGSASIQTGNLTPASPSNTLPVSGNSVAVTASNGGSFDAERALTPITGTPGTTLWVGVVMKGTGAIGNSSQGALLISDGSGNGFSITTGAGGFGMAPNNPPANAFWSLSDAGLGSTEASSTVSNTLQSLLVASVTFGSATDTVNLYVNPPLTGSPPSVPSATEPLSHTASFTTLDLSYSTVGTPATSTLFDEIRMGDTFADVTGTAVPEPSSLLLVGFAGLGWFKRRRR